MDNQAFAVWPWNFHVGQEGRRLKAKQDRLESLLSLGLYEALKHSSTEITAWSLYLCVSLGAFTGWWWYVIRIAQLQAWSYTALSFGQTDHPVHVQSADFTITLSVLCSIQSLVTPLFVYFCPPQPPHMSKSFTSRHKTSWFLWLIIHPTKS